MKVSIPKEKLEEIKEKYGVDDTQAARAFLEADTAAQKTYEQELTKQLGEKKEGETQWEMPRLTPTEIKEHLDKYVIGQEEYKKRLSIAAAFHFAMIKYQEDYPEESRVKRFRKKNTLIAGPSGSGKTYCAEVLGDLLDLPTLVVDATDYTEAGYVGKSADDMIRELIDLAPGGSRQEKARFVDRYGGIIFIDEIDKKAKDGKVIGHDISREGFQRAVLKLIERKFVSMDNPMSPSHQIQEMMNRQRGITDPQDNMISTERILFIVGGSFQRPKENLEWIVKDRIRRQQSGRSVDDDRVVIAGFSVSESGSSSESMWNYYKEANADDYIRFGIIPELVGRVPIRSHVNLLSKNDLVRIMRDTEDSIIHQYEEEFQSFDIELKVEEEAIDYVAEQAENKKTGARALVSVWENILTDFQYELPGSNFKELVISKNLCLTPKDALLEMLKRSPFVDFIEKFKREYGIQLTFADGVEAYVRQYAKENKLQISDALKNLLNQASALNYMNVEGEFEVTAEMLKDPKYFDNLFTQWFQKSHPQSKKNHQS